MVRTVISVHEKDHIWLRKAAMSQHVSMTELIRRAIEQYRQTVSFEGSSSVEKILKATRGIWKQGDGLKFQQKIREEWK